METSQAAASHSENIYIPDVIRGLWKRKHSILCGAAIGSFFFLAVSWFLVTPLYEASVTLYVNNSISKENIGYITQGDLYASTQLVDTYAAIILSDSILEDVIRDAGLDMEIDDLARILDMDAVNDTEVFTVSARHPSPETAAEIVDSIARIAPEQIADIVRGSSVTVISYARIPKEIAFPNYSLMTLIGFISGTCLVSGFLLIRELLNTRIQTAADFSRWKYPLIASVPNFLDKKQADCGYGQKRNTKKKSRTVSCMLSENTPFAVQEAYKTLRTNILFSSPDQGKRVILISSSLRGEAKSTTSINLSIAFAQNQSSVLLIDCDLRLPSIAKYLGLRQSPGLTDLILGMETDKSVFHVLKSGLHVLTSGTIPPNPTEMLGSKKMGHFITHMSEQYNYIIIDTPPLGIMPDAAILSQYATDVILVARQDMAERAELDAVVKKLELAKAKILGFVFTDVTESNRSAYKKYSYHYSYPRQNVSEDSQDVPKKSRRKPGVYLAGEKAGDKS